ncbi:hypothetical protein EMIT0196MI5_180038 [Pseudomonas sp. IT-196MI5]
MYHAELPKAAIFCSCLSGIKLKDRSLVALDSSYREMRTHEEPGRPVGRLGRCCGTRPLMP